MSSETPTIHAELRTHTGSRHARRLRQSGRLPAVVYGHKTDPQAISVDEEDILKRLHQGIHVLKLDIKGGRTETCLVKDLQFGYLGDDVIHVDFARVNLDEEVNVQVHLTFVGEPAAAQKAGAILSHDLTDLEVVCRVSDIPEEIKVDLTDMESTHTVGQIALPPTVRAAADPATVVAHISYVHAEEPVGEEVEVEAAPEEPEVITEAAAEEEKPAEEGR